MSPRRICRDSKGNRDNKPRPISVKRKSRPLNRHEMEQETASTSKSTKKLKMNEKIDIAVNASFGYRLINFVSVFNALSDLVKCKKCDGEVTFLEGSIRGLGFKLIVKCKSCEPSGIDSCPLINSKAYEINRRITFVFRLLGMGYAALEKFCGLMDLQRSFTEKFYNDISTHIFVAAESIAEKSMQNAVKLEKEATEKGGLTVSGDGTWHRRGFSSLFGLSTLIGYYTGKVVDILVKSSYCKQCETWEKVSATPEYALWKEDHMDRCQSNHEGSAGKMEVSAIQEMFQRSEEKYDVQYHNYIGDGDSKTFKAILDCHPYENATVMKKECIGHIQKRMGTRLRNLKKKTKGLGGKGKLTDKLINELTIYYGLAIRRNTNSWEKMKDATWATFYHKISTNEHPQHHLCDSSWCSWLQAKEKNELNNYKHPNPLPQNVQDAIQPIYVDLTAEDLLKRCEGGFTQNCNESLNALIWSIAPKTKFCGKHTIDFAANTATSMFNDVYDSILLMMQCMNFVIGTNCFNLCKSLDEKRLK
nr:uncharacterized protein LOC111420331 [Onthophagus taurus]